MIKAKAFSTALAAGIAISALPAAGQDRPPMGCIMVGKNAVARTEIVDEQTIDFYMRGDDAYRVRLTSPCNNLTVQRSFSYTVDNERLCETGSITVQRVGSICQIDTIRTLPDEKRRPDPR